MSDDPHEIFRLAARHFFEKYKDRGGTQRRIAKKLGITQSYVSSVFSGVKSASLELQSQMANILYGGPYEEFLTIGRRIKNGLDPEIHIKKDIEDSVESLIARLSHYVVDHQRIENELLNMRDFYESTLKMLPAGVMVYSAQHTAAYVNPQMVDYIGVPKEKILGADFYEASKEYPGRDLSAVVPYYNEAIETLEPVHYDHARVVTSGGNEMIMTGWMVPQVKDNKFNGMIFTVIDNTEQAKLQQQVADEKDKIQSILENIYSAIILINDDGYVTFSNPAAERIAKITLEEFRDFNIFEDYKIKFPKANFVELIGIIKRVFKTSEAEFFDGIHTLNSMGEPVARTGWTIPIKNSDGKITGVAVSVRDDEELNLIKSKVAHLNESLLATLEYVDCPVIIALQDQAGGLVSSFHMNITAMELMELDQYDLEPGNLQNSMLASAALMENGDEWLKVTKQNFTGEEFAEMTINMKDGRKFTWESKSLRDQKGTYHGRIVHMRERI